MPDNSILNRIEADFTAFAHPRYSDRIYLHLDKTLYKPGETIWFHTYLCDETDLQSSPRSEVLYVVLINPKGSIQEELHLAAKNGVAPGDFFLPADIAGGIYTIKAFTNWQKNDENPVFFEKQIQVQQVILPRLKMKLDFEKEAYGAGDTVSAELTLESLANESIAQKDLRFVLNLRGKKALEGTAQTNADGVATVRFTLPKDLQTADGLLNILLDYHGQTESISRSVPIVLTAISLEFFPEGGEMVSGFEGRVAFRALNEFGKPADIEAVLSDSNGNELLHFGSFHQGMGAFRFTPVKGKQYAAKILRPQGIGQTFPLSQPRERGYTLEVDALQKEQLHFVVRSWRPETLYIVVQVRGVICHKQEIEAKEGENRLSILSKDFPSGVAQVTLFDSRGIERAERLVFVNPHKKLNIQIKTDKQKYQPREKVTMEIRVSDEHNNPVSAQLSLAVVDDKLLSFVDDKQGHILSKLLLEPDVKGEIFEPNFYFDDKEEKAPQALDYLLMTQGWRKFTWKEVYDRKPFEVKHEAEKVFMTGTVYGWNYGPWEGEGAWPKFIPIPYAQVKALAFGYNIRNREFFTDENGRFVIRCGDLSKGKKHLLSGVDRATFGIGLFDGEDRITGAKLKFASSNRVYNSGIHPYFVFDSIPLDRKLEPEEELVAEETLLQGVLMDKEGKPLAGKKLRIGKFRLHKTYTADAQGKYRIDDLVIHRKAPVLLSTRDQPYSKYRQYDTETFVFDYYDKMDFYNLCYEAWKDMIKNGCLGGSSVTEDPGPSLSSAVSDRVLAPVATLAAQQMQATIKDERGHIVSTERTNFPSYWSWSTDIWQHRYTYLYSRYARQREFYAPVYDKAEKPKMRTDFRSTLFWAGIESDNEGFASIEFYNSDDSTSFRAVVEGMSNSGLPGHQEHLHYVQNVLGMSVKIPAELSGNDEVVIPVTLVNHADYEIGGKLEVFISMKWQPIQELPQDLILEPNNYQTIYLPYRVANTGGKARIALILTSNDGWEAFEQQVSVRPQGFPVSASVSAKELNKKLEIKMFRPVPGSGQAWFTAYTSQTSEILTGIESMLREPWGCFEQVSSITYPNILILEHLRRSSWRYPGEITRAEQFIEQGYKKLAGYETQEGGFSWFGHSPGHEALTAYGLVEFKAMKEVYPKVDEEMITRTRQWLLSRRDGKGRFKPTSYKWGGGWAETDIMNAYLVYALSEVDPADIEAELATAYLDVRECDDAYRLALVTIALFNAADERQAFGLLDRLLLMQSAQGEWTGATHSITHSTGISLAVETTSLAMLALVKALAKVDRESQKKQELDVALLKAGLFLATRRSPYGGFGSTQGTVLALQALLNCNTSDKRSYYRAVLELIINGKSVKEFPYTSYDHHVLKADDLWQHLNEDNNTIQVQFKDTQEALPYTFSVSYSTLQPPNSPECSVRLDTSLSAETIRVGETVRLSTRLYNVTDQGLPMTLAIVGIPAGLSPQPWQLKELSEKKRVDFYEVIGSNVVFYYEQMQPSEVKEIHLDLKAEVPGTFRAIASCAYLYYTNEFKYWTEGETVSIRN